MARLRDRNYLEDVLDRRNVARSGHEFDNDVVATRFDCQSTLRLSPTTWLPSVVIRASSVLSGGVMPCIVLPFARLTRSCTVSGFWSTDIAAGISRPAGSTYE